MSDVITFALRDEYGNEYGVSQKNSISNRFKSSKRCKKAKSKPVIIHLKERGTKKVHVFKAWKELVEAPKNRPDWMPEKISKPFVKKEKIEMIE